MEGELSALLVFLSSLGALLCFRRSGLTLAHALLLSDWILHHPAFTKADPMRQLLTTLTLTVTLVSLMTGCVTCPDEDIIDCGPNARAVPDDSELLCGSSRCEPIRGCDPNVMNTTLSCAPGFEPSLERNELGCWEQVCEPLYMPYCDPVVRSCLEGEEEVWVSSEDGCEWVECLPAGGLALSPRDFSVEATVTWSDEERQQYILLSDDGLRATVEEDSVNDTVLATAYTSTGRWYWEVTLESVGESSYNSVGVCAQGQSLEVSPSSYGGVGYEHHGLISYERWERFEGGRAYDEGDTVGVILDAGLKRVWFILHGQLIGGGDPASGTGGVPLAEDVERWVPCLNLSRSYVYEANFGQAEWVYGQPQGFTIPGIE